MNLEKLLLTGLLIVVSGGTVALLVHAIRTKQRLESAWTSFAQRVGTLRVERDQTDWPQLVGSYRERNVNGRMLARGGSGESRSIHTLVSAPCTRQLPNNFALRPQSMFFALEKAYGAQDIQLGDPLFDRAFVIEGADEAEVRALLSDPSVRQALLKHAEVEPALTVSGGQVSVENSGEVTKPGELASMFDAVTLAAQALDAATTTHAMQHHQQTAGESRQWLLERDYRKVFAAAMTIPVGFAVAIAAGGLLPRPYGWLGWIGAVLLVALGIKLLLPPKPRLRLTPSELVLERGGEQLVFPLQQSRFWCGPWHQSGYACGSLLHVQAGERTLVIGGAQHVFDDPRWYQAAAAGHPDVAMLKRPFADLLNGLGYAMRRRHG